MPHQATFYSKSLFEKYGCYDESFHTMDYEYAARIGKKKAKFMNVIVCSFREGGFSMENKEIINQENDLIAKKYFKFPELYIFLRTLYKKIFLG